MCPVRTKLSSNHRIQIEKFVFEELPNALSIAEIGKVKKMTGYREYYKALLGPYRVGIKRGDEALIVEVVMDRKDIYQFYP